MNKDFWLKLWKRFAQTAVKPPVWLQIITFPVMLCSCAGAIALAVIQPQAMIWEIFSYALYALAALSLAYAVYIAIPVFPRAKRWFVAQAEKREFTNTLIRNYNFRTIVFACGSFCTSIAFGVLNGYKGLFFQSIWFGALAAYYVCLAFLRGGVLFFHKNNRNDNATPNELAVAKAKNYRNCGITLLVLNVALSSAIAQMIFDDRAFSYADWTIFAYAAYAFYKLTMAIYNLFKAKRQDDLTIQAVRNVNLIDATVSILALQTALLHAFTTTDVNISLFNTLTGAAVSLFSIGVAVAMIYHGNRCTKIYATENDHAR